MGRVQQNVLTGGSAFVGRTGQDADVVAVTLGGDAAALIDNDIIFDFTEISNFFREEGGRAVIDSIRLLDESDQAQDIDLIFANATGDLGNVNGAVNISNADARNIETVVSLLTTDYVDLINSQVAIKGALGRVVEAASGSRSLFVAGVCRSGLPTYAADGLKLKIGVRHL